MECEHCGRKLYKTDRRTEMAELNAEATDGQMADYLANELSGDHHAWGLGIVEYQCSGCHRAFQMISDELQSYHPLISNWHQKAMGGDYFSRFVFEYLAFVAHLKNNLYIAAPSDRKAMQKLKQAKDKHQAYLALVQENKRLETAWKNVIDELNRHPLHNSSRDMDYPEIDNWWNQSKNELIRNDESPKGVIHSMSDWSNMIEFWYSVRNNLFHGGKDPSIQRDRFLVEHAYKTLAAFMECEIAAFKT